MSQANRDVFLDIAKGLAIIIVVVGHVFQRASADYDNFFPFRLVYSFHMPMFMCLAGMVASLKMTSFSELSEAHSLIDKTKNGILSSAKRLLIPFIAWTAIYSFRNQDYSMLDYIFFSFKHPMASLWFLLILFYCHALFMLMRAGISFFRLFIFNKYKRDLVIFNNYILYILLIVIIYFTFRKLLPDSYGLDIVKKLFPYYVLGIFIYKEWRTILDSKVVKCILTIIFFILVPFWYRVNVGPVEIWLSSFIPAGKAVLIFHFAVAICGIFFFFLCVNVLLKIRSQFLARFLAFCGKMSLGIYAIHSLILDIPPAFVTALGGSILITMAIKRIPIARLVLLGEKSVKAK